MYLFSIGFLSSDEWTPNEGRTADIADKRAGIADKPQTSPVNGDFIFHSLKTNSGDST